MCNDHSDDSGSKPEKPVDRPHAVFADDKSVRRTVLLRIQSKADTDTLESDINAAGASIVSKGTGVFVIEGTGESIDNLRTHESIIKIEEPGQLQMKRSVNIPKNKIPDS